MNNARKPYRGRLQAVVLDWAGTTVDYGSLAPVRVLQKIFADRGIAVTEVEVHPVFHDETATIAHPNYTVRIHRVLQSSLTLSIISNRMTVGRLLSNQPFRTYRRDEK